jgi:ArsR family transcriptional regulator
MINFNEQYLKKAELLKALGHPVRLCIVRGLIEHKTCNVTYIQECLALPQSTVSRHLATLRSAGIVNFDRNKVEVCYKVDNPEVIELIKTLFKEVE